MILRQQIIPTCISNIYPSRDLNVVGQLTFADTKLSLHVMNAMDISKYLNRSYA